MEEKHNEKQLLTMASERTPLIQSVPIEEREPRYPHNRVSIECQSTICNSKLTFV